MYGIARASTSAPCVTACGSMPWVMSRTRASGAILLITPWQTPTKSSWRPKSVRKVIVSHGHAHTDSIRSRTAATSPSRSCVAASRGDRRGRRHERREPSRGRCVTAGAAPPIHGVGASQPSRTRARRASPSGGSGGDRRVAVERDEVGAELVDRATARASSAAAKSTRALRPREARRSRPSCEDTLGTKRARCPCARSVSAVPGPTAATFGRFAPRRASSSAPFGLVTISQS